MYMLLLGFIYIFTYHMIISPGSALKSFQGRKLLGGKVPPAINSELEKRERANLQILNCHPRDSSSVVGLG